MAFQTGTRVDPRLGALDFSGFTNAANIQAQGMMDLGEAIGGAIEKYNKKKEDKRKKEVTRKAIGELADFYDIKISDEMKDAMASDKTVAGIATNFFTNQNKIKLEQLELEDKTRNSDALQTAFNANTEAGTGKINKAGLVDVYIDQGGTNLADIKTLSSIGNPEEKSDTAKIKDYNFLVPLVGEERAMEIVFVRRTDLEKLIQKMNEGEFNLNPGTTPTDDNDEFSNFSIVPTE